MIQSNDIPLNNESRLLKRLAMTLKQVRRESNITQDQVKQHTGVHLDKIESGKQNITLCTLKKVCDHCGISMSEFMKKLEKI